jgi:hypothetical protein
MARTVRGGSIETRSARLRLAARSRPYWAPSGKPGLHLGYRRLVKTNGSWIVRRYQGKPGEYDSKAFAQADDFSDADGQTSVDHLPAMNVTLRGRDKWMSDGMARFGIVSVHQGHQADIEITGPDAAKGIWAFTDRMFFPAGGDISRLTGYGFYHETYVRVGEAWQIKTNCHSRTGRDRPEAKPKTGRPHSTLSCLCPPSALRHSIVDLGVDVCSRAEIRRPGMPIAPPSIPTQQLILIARSREYYRDDHSRSISVVSYDKIPVARQCNRHYQSRRSLGEF